MNKIKLIKSFAGYPVGEYTLGNEYYTCTESYPKIVIHKDIVEKFKDHFEELKEHLESLA